MVPENARIEGRTALSVNLLYRYGVTLLGVSRQGTAVRERVRKLTIRAGDVLLLLGPSERLKDVALWLGGLPLQERDLQITQRNKAGIAVASFVLAIAAATAGILHLPEALALVCITMVEFNIVPLRKIYTSIEWPVIVLLGSMIPIGSALEASGGTELIANQIVNFAEGYGPVVVLTLLMIVTMTLSDVLNNTATTVIAAMRREAAVAIGNVIGSNLFNILFVLPISALVRPLPIPSGGLLDVVLSLVLAVAIVLVFLTGKALMGRLTGLLFALAYVAYMGYRVLGA